MQSKMLGLKENWIILFLLKWILIFFIDLFWIMLQVKYIMNKNNKLFIYVDVYLITISIEYS